MGDLELLDISLPSELPWYSFSAITWGLIALVGLLIFAWGYWFFVVRRQSKKYLVFKEIFKKLEAIEEQLTERQISNHQLAQELDSLVKRAARSFLDQSSIRKLKNNHLWFEYLNSKVKKNYLAEEIKAIFINAPYAPNMDYQPEQYLHALKNYLLELKKNI